jgi:ribonuclease-3
MEAVIAAIYLDGGITEAEKFTVNLLKDSIEKVRKGKGKFKDYKTELQEQVSKMKEVSAIFTSKRKARSI